MERRWSKRKVIEHEVLLRFEGVGLVRCQTRDISFEGALIETNSVMVPHGADLDLSFVPVQVDCDEVRLGGKVVRVMPEGVAVSFIDYHDGAYQFLLNVLK